VTNRSFKCPVCGSREWGTSNASKTFREWRGHCQECTFSWPRTDDANYWEPVDVEWDEEQGEEASEC
jgi:transcription elongation factor Elf1